MLLFSTTLEIEDNFNKHDFINMVLEWNSSSPHAENIIPGIEWNGEPSVRYGNDKLWLAIEDYCNKNIVAVRYEKVESDGVIWDTDYIMNFDDMRMAVQLHRSYTEDVLETDGTFSTPYFIAKLIDNGCVDTDNKLEVLKRPHVIKQDNLSVLDSIVNNKAKYLLPVVYVSKTRENEYPVNVDDLAYKLKGIAHVLAEYDKSLDNDVRILCGDNVSYNGSISIYFPNFKNNRRFKYRTYMNKSAIFSKNVIDSVFQYCNMIKVDELYTWYGVMNAILKDKLERQYHRIGEVEDEKKKADIEVEKLYNTFDQDFKDMQSKIDELTKRNNSLEQENYGLKQKMERNKSVPIIYHGDEVELFNGEIKDIIIDALQEYLKNSVPDKSRRFDVISDIIENNEKSGAYEQRKNSVKNIFKGYKNFTSSMKKALSDIGIEVSDDKRHLKLTYYGDPRYMTTVAKTPSDGRDGMNVAQTIISMMM